MAFKRKKSYKRSAIKRRRTSRSYKGTRKRSYRLKRRSTKGRRGGMPNSIVRQTRRIRPAPGTGLHVPRKGLYHLVTNWISPGMTRVTVLNTPAMFCTALNMNTLQSAAHIADFGVGWGSANYLPPAGLQQLAVQYNTMMTVAYRLSIYDLTCVEGLDGVEPMEVSLCPISYDDWKANFTGSATAEVWPGATVNVKWQNMIDQPFRKIGRVGASLDGPKLGALKYLSCGVHMNQIITDPGWQAVPGYHEKPPISGIAAAYRDKMIITHMFQNPSANANRLYTCRYKEEWWVKAFDPEMPGLIAEAQDYGAEKAREFIEERKKETKEAQDKQAIDGEFVPPEGDFEDIIMGVKIEDPPVPVYTPPPPPTPVVTPSILPRLPSLPPTFKRTK